MSVPEVQSMILQYEDTKKWYWGLGSSAYGLLLRSTRSWDKQEDALANASYWLDAMGMGKPTWHSFDDGGTPV